MYIAAFDGSTADPRIAVIAAFTGQSTVDCLTDVEAQVGGSYTRESVIIDALEGVVIALHKGLSWSDVVRMTDNTVTV